MNSFHHYLPALKTRAPLLARALLLACLCAIIAGLVWPAGLEAQGPGPAQAGAQARPLDSTENILLLGTDVRPGDATWRTDVIILAAIDRQNGRVGLLSIPPHLIVDIPGAGRDGIRTVDFLGEQRDGPGGGPQLLGTVLQQTLGVRTDHYVRMEMSQFARLIDVLGGITIVLDKPLREVNKGGDLTLDAGRHRLDGATTLTYLRACQYTGNLDCPRRQQEVVSAILQRLKELNWLTQLPSLWNIYRSMVQTDLSLPDALSLALIGTRLQAGQIHLLPFDYSLATTTTTERGAQGLVLGDRSRVDAWVDSVFNAPCLGCSETAQRASSAPATPARPASAWGTVLRSVARACTWAADAGLAPARTCSSAPSARP